MSGPGDITAGSTAGEIHGTDGTPVDIAPDGQIERGGRRILKLLVAVGRGEGGVGRTEPRIGRRLVSQGGIVGHADAGEDAADDCGGDQREGEGGGQPSPADPRLGDQLTTDAETGEQAGGQQRHGPWVDDLRGREERLGTAGEHLGRDAGDGWDKEQPRDQAEPEDPRRATVAPDQRRPHYRGDADQQRQQGGDADEQVERTAGPVGDQNDTAARGPEDGEGGGQKPQLE